MGLKVAKYSAEVMLVCDMRELMMAAGDVDIVAGRHK